MLLLVLLVHFALALPILGHRVKRPTILASVGIFKDGSCDSVPRVVYLLENECFESPGSGTSMELIRVRSTNDYGRRCQGIGNRVRVLNYLLT